MAALESFEALILGSGHGGKLIAWHLTRSGRRTAVVERHWIGSPCQTVAYSSAVTREPWRDQRHAGEP